MMPPNTLHRTSEDEARLRLTAEELLQQALRRPVQVRSLKCKPSPFASRVPAEVLSLTLEDGEAMALFLKSQGSEEADHPDKQVRDREARIYDELLTAPELPVVRFYGFRWNEETARREIFLEYIGDWDLRYQELDYWFVAARRLARLHAYFAKRAAYLQDIGFLQRFDAAYLGAWAERALAVLTGQSAELAAGLETVIERYDCVTRVLAQQPPTLVHNDLAAKNVLVDRGASAPRICFVDWEMAGLGCGLLDLVTLKYGLDPENDRKMCAAYAAELNGTGLFPLDPRDLDRVLAACELHKAMIRLWRNRVWQVPMERVRGWIAECRQLLVQVRDGG